MKNKTTVKQRQIEQKTLLIGQFKKTPIVQVACEKTAIGRSTYYRWRKEDKDFANEADEALQEGCLLVNDMAESQLISAIREKNLTAIIFWLKHHHNTYRTRVELSGKIETGEELTTEQKNIIEKALALASMNSTDLKTNEKESD
ncbi:hypothetical protein KJ662_03335 [Patescibacteria group bacterium]|nr:hypothetical protein [Patescibacteria group bacterium]